MWKEWFHWLMQNNKRSFAKRKLESPVTCREKNEIFLLFFDGQKNVHDVLYNWHKIIERKNYYDNYCHFAFL